MSGTTESSIRHYQRPRPASPQEPEKKQIEHYRMVSPREEEWVRERDTPLSISVRRSLRRGLSVYILYWQRQTQNHQLNSFKIWLEWYGLDWKLVSWEGGEHHNTHNNNNTIWGAQVFCVFVAIEAHFDVCVWCVCVLSCLGISFLRDPVAS